MKRYLYILLFILPISVSSQNMYNITSLLDNVPSGTARFTAMGGSMGSLGADVSVMGVNPAGTAVYRSNDFSLTGGLDITDCYSALGNGREKSRFLGGKLSNFGIVIAYDPELEDLKFLNFGLNYKKRNGFAENFSMQSAAGYYSQQYIIKELYDNNPFDVNSMTSAMYENLSYNWLTLLAADGGLKDENGNFLVNPEGALLFTPTDYGYNSETRGGVNDVDFNVSANIEDRIYVGATLGFHIVDYSRYSRYYEDDDFGEIYNLVNNYRIDGAGVDFKIGAIFRPFKYSPFKVGVAVHTPAIYSLKDISSASLQGPYSDPFDTSSDLCYGDEFYVKYSLRTPWRFNASASYTFGNFLALNAEYEFADASSTAFMGKSDFARAQNKEISYNLRPQHTARVGAEVLLKRLAIRAGYNYISAPFDEAAYKELDNAIITDTSTEYMNRYGKNIVTFGFGYAGKMLYFDAAYMLQMQNSNFYPFYDRVYQTPVTKVNMKGHTVMATLGVRL